MLLNGDPFNYKNLYKEIKVKFFMPTCSFCSNQVLKGSGVLYAKKDGTIYYFCSSKCRRNQLDLGREGRRKKWTKAYRLFKDLEKKTGDMPSSETRAQTKAIKKL